MPRSETKKFGDVELHTTKFMAMHGMTLMGKVLRAVPKDADPNSGLVGGVMSDKALVLEMFSNTFAICKPAGAPEIQRLDLTSEAQINLVFHDNTAHLIEALNWVLGILTEDFPKGGQPGASVRAPTA